MLRAMLVATLAIALWRSVRAAGAGARSDAVRASALGDWLDRATASPRIGALSVEVDTALGPARRDWLVALRRAGLRVSWRGEVPSLAVAADRAREPAASARVRLVGDSGVSVIRDSIGVIDSVRAGNGASIDAPDLVGTVTVRRGAFSASAALPAREQRRAVLVLGRAGWESRFVIAALGEAGWQARGRLPVAPGVSVVDASLLPIDTARYDVVIVLDSTAADLAPTLARFVAQGGGAIVAGSALGIGGLRALAPARAGDRHAGRILLDDDTLTRADLPLRPLVDARVDIVALERQPAGIVVAIRRSGRGRIAAVGYDESWRWRMQGGEAGEAAHRAWWSRMTGLVAPARANATGSSIAAAEAAPRAALFAALGPPSRSAEVHEQTTSSRLPLALLLLALAALLAETASRRFRGAS